MTEEEKWKAVLENDKDCDGAFFYGVKSTGIYCRPSCASKPPKRENVEFFDSTAEAGQAGFRPCKRCRPDLAAYDPTAGLAREAKRLMEQSFAGREELRERLNALGVTRRHLAEVFEKQYGVSPEQYIAGLRLAKAKELLEEGSTVTDAAFAVGLGSSAAFTAFFKKHVGMPPSEYRMRQTEEYPHCFCDTPLGTVRMGEDGSGITSLRFADGKLEPGKIRKAGLYLPDAAAQLAEYFAGKRKAFDIPLSLRGTRFQESVWKALREIPYGETRNYQQLAAAIGNEKAARAVGGANNRNPVLIFVPCHRVVGKDGTLVGYAGGIGRKQYLLEMEAKK